MGRRLFSVVLGVLLCTAGLAAVAAIELMPLVSGWLDVALVATVVVTALLSSYLIVRPPNFRDEGDDDSGGGEGPRPMRPEPSGPDEGLPDPDWSSFDDLRNDWEREPIGA